MVSESGLFSEWQKINNLNQLSWTLPCKTLFFRCFSEDTEQSEMARRDLRD